MFEQESNKEVDSEKAVQMTDLHSSQEASLSLGSESLIDNVSEHDSDNEQELITHLNLVVKTSPALISKSYNFTN